MNLLTDHGWLVWIIIGGIAGLIARAIMPGKDPGGCLVTILLGIAGAVVAGFLGHLLGLDPQNRGASWIAAIIGAIIILFVYRMVAGRRQ
jgi:uncharacterized membrane protein YeaQ/YmgE (transglycosylase-associated protein family)